VLTSKTSDSGTGAVSITGGTGLFAGATGSFPSISGSGFSTPTGFSVSFGGAGTITTASNSGGGGGGGGGGNTPPTGPTITGVVNNYSFVPAGFPNSGVAPSSIFTIFGTGMAAASNPQTLNTSAAPGIPTTFNGTSVSVTVGATTLPVGLYYALPVQIAGVLPAATPTGAGTITVTYNGTASNQFAIQVIPSGVGLDTYLGTGSGLITMTDAHTAVLHDYTNSAATGEKVTLWGTGLGSDPSDSDTVFSTTPHAVNQASVQVYFGAIQATVSYAGSSGFPGLDQINVIVPAGITGCFVPVVVVVNGISSNFPTAPIANNNGPCTDATFGFTGTQLSTLNGQTTVKSGSVFVGQSISPDANGSPMTNNFASANFESVTGASFGSSGGYATIGSCVVTEVVTAAGGVVTSTGLEAGTITLAGPGGTNYTLTENTTGSYAQLLPANAITGSGGTFVYTGAGGTDVGAFMATINLPNPILSWTNQGAGATVTRSEGVLVTWTGGTPGSNVYITGISSGANGATGTFTCYAPQSALQFMVPPFVTGTLPAGTGTLSAENLTDFISFTATGIDHGSGFGFTGNLIDSTYQ
jgi:uncharacterized protein (TIGR03437 family)